MSKIAGARLGGYLAPAQWLPGAWHTLPQIIPPHARAQRSHRACQAQAVLQPGKGPARLLPTGTEETEGEPPHQVCLDKEKGEGNRRKPRPHRWPAPWPSRPSSCPSGTRPSRMTASLPLGHKAPDALVMEHGIRAAPATRPRTRRRCGRAGREDFGQRPQGVRTVLLHRSRPALWTRVLCRLVTGPWAAPPPHPRKSPSH